MKGNGKYIRVWVYDSNAQYLDSVENKSRTVNEALAAYSQMQTGNITLPVDNLDSTNGAALATITTSTAGTTPRAFNITAPSLTGNTSSTFTMSQEPPKLVCDNGHLLNALTGKCVGKQCEYAK